jgi:hypothetical protein
LEAKERKVVAATLAMKESKKGAIGTRPAEKGEFCGVSNFEEEVLSQNLHGSWGKSPNA